MVVLCSGMYVLFETGILLFISYVTSDNVLDMTLLCISVVSHLLFENYCVSFSCICINVFVSMQPSIF